MNRLALGVVAWLCFIFFIAGFACSRIHDSERVSRVLTEQRAIRDQWRARIMELERLPGVWPEDRCFRNGNVVRCSDGSRIDLTEDE